MFSLFISRAKGLIALLKKPTNSYSANMLTSPVSEVENTLKRNKKELNKQE